MKKYLILASAAIVVLAACNKESDFVTPEESNNEVVLTFASARPQLDDETKTAWDGSKLVWSTTDKIRVGFKKDGSWWSQSAAADATAEPATYPKFYASSEVTIDGTDSSVGTFSVPMGTDKFSDPAVSGNYQFFAVYPQALLDGTNVNNPAAKNLTIKETQSPSSNTFDAAADVLLGKSVEMSINKLPTDPIELTWQRVVSHAVLTFSNMSFIGTENVSKITLTFNDQAKVTGTVTANIEEGTVGEGTSNVLILDNGFTVSGSSISVWACVLPVKFTSLNVEIKTDKATYTRSITGISGKEFKKNAKNTLTINMASADRDAIDPDDFNLYSGDISEGDYVIYYGGKAMKAAASSNRLQYTEVTPSNDIISINDNSLVWHIAESATSGYWTIYNASEEKYAAATGSKNQAQLLASGTDDQSLWAVTGSDTYEFENKARAAADKDSGNKWLRNNGANGFACYASSTGGALSLYTKDARSRIEAPATVTAQVNSTDDTQIDVTFSSVSGAASYVIVATPVSGTAVTKANITSSPASISVADGLAYSTAYYIAVYAVPSSNTYRNSVPKYATGTVTTGDAPAAPATTVSTILSGGNTDAITLPTGTIMAKQGDYTIISDNTGSILAYQATGTYAIGDVVSVTGKISTFSNAYQFSKPAITVTSSPGAPTYPSDNVIDTDTPLTTYATGDASTVRVTYATLKGTVNASGNIVIGTKTVTVYSALSSLSGKAVIAQGYLTGYYNSNIYFVNVSAVEDNTTPTISVSPSSLSWAAAETDSKNLTVTLNGSAAVDYYGYTVTSGTASDWTITKNGGTLSIAPKAANTSTSASKSITLRIAHNGDTDVYQDVTCTQAASGSFSLVLSFPDDNSNNNGLTSAQYTSTWTATSGSYSFSISNYNNNNWNNSWTYIKGGSKASSAGTAKVWNGTITTTTLIAAPIAQVIVDYGQIGCSKKTSGTTYYGTITAAKLEVSTLSTFATISETINGVPTSTGEYAYEITTPIENAYYRLTVTTSNESEQNGVFRIDSIVYTTETN